MHKLENSRACFIALWQQLEATRRLFLMQGRRYCVRRIVQAWWHHLREYYARRIDKPPDQSGLSDDLITDICMRSQLRGYEQLPPPTINPLPHRSFLHALITLCLGIREKSVKLSDIDQAFSEAFPTARKIDTKKKGPAH